MRAVAAFWFLLAASPAAAQEQITPDAFLDLALGRTLSFTGVTSGLHLWPDRAARAIVVFYL